MWYIGMDFLNDSELFSPLSIVIENERFASISIQSFLLFLLRNTHDNESIFIFINTFYQTQKISRAVEV